LEYWTVAVFPSAKLSQVHVETPQAVTVEWPVPPKLFSAPEA
jgi:hypothetical protein